MSTHIYEFRRSREGGTDEVVWFAAVSLEDATAQWRQYCNDPGPGTSLTGEDEPDAVRVIASEDALGDDEMPGFVPKK